MRTHFMIRLSFVALPVLTSLCMFLLCLSLFSRQWEHIEFDVEQLRGIESRTRTVSIPNRTRVVYFFILIRRTGGYSLPVNNTTLIATSRFGGLWEICSHLPESVYVEYRELRQCLSYMDIYHTSGEAYSNSAYRIMMQLTRSAEMCGIVALLLVTLGLLLGLLAVLRHQVICALIAGISVLVAGFYEVFTICLMIIRRLQLVSTAIAADTFAEDISDILAAKSTVNGWSMAVMWASCACCIVTSFFWIIIFNVMQKDATNDIIKYPQLCAA